MRVLGVDPGISGGLCVLEGGKVLDAIDPPVIGEGTKRMISSVGLGRWLEQWSPDFAWIEDSWPRPNDGAVQAFRFGRASGQIRAVIECYEIPCTAISPQVWKKHFMLVGPLKEQSRQRCLQLLPAAAGFFLRKMDHGRAEAALIALYGAQRLGML